MGYGERGERKANMVYLICVWRLTSRHLTSACLILLCLAHTHVALTRDLRRWVPILSKGEAATQTARPSTVGFITTRRRRGAWDRQTVGGTQGGDEAILLSPCTPKSHTSRHLWRGKVVSHDSPCRAYAERAESVGEGSVRR